MGRGQNRGNYATIESHDAEKRVVGYNLCPYHKAFQSPCKAVAALVMSFPSK